MLIPKTSISIDVEDVEGFITFPGSQNVVSGRMGTYCHAGEAPGGF